MDVSKIGRQQFKIMRVLWDKGQATAREITDALNEREHFTHSSVQTLLRQLEKKGAITHGVEDSGYGCGTYVYRPLVGREKILLNATHELLDRLFDGSPGQLVTHLLRHERLTRKDLEGFIEAVQAQRGKMISEQDADALIDAARARITRLHDGR